ncbi:MAG: hypothetical protein HY821_03780 [Acidobacteria bacterium]|nr:hypothetical protein [Acidobacteriota bacterium]
MRNVISFFVPWLVGAALAQGGELRVGSAAVKITPKLDGAPVYLAGFDNGRAATGVHDELWARCLAISAGAKPVAICAVDVIGLFHDDVKKVRAAAPEAQVIVAATHVHEGPDTMGQWGAKQGVSGIQEGYNSFVVSQTAAAVKEAIAKMAPAVAYPAAVTPADVDGYFDDDRPPFVHDSEILSVTFKGKNGKALGTLVNWSNHPEALGSKNTLITSDWPHFLRASLEAQGSGTVVYVNGAVGGMQSPLGAKITDPKTGQPAPAVSFRFAEVVGEYAAGHVVASQKKAKAVKLDGVEYTEEAVTIPVANQMFLLGAQMGIFGGRKAFGESRETAVPVGYLKLTAKGKPVVEAALIPGEAYPEISVGGVSCDANSEFASAPAEAPIKKQMTGPYRMLFGLANDEIGYIIPKCQWDEKPPYTYGATKRWYGEVNSVGPEAAPRITSAFQGLLAR